MKKKKTNNLIETNQEFVFENKNYLQMKDQLDFQLKEQKKREMLNVDSNIIEIDELLAATVDSFPLPSRKNREIHSPIIDGNQKKTNKLMETLFTTIGWGAVVAFLLQFPVTIFLWIFNFSSLKSILFIKFNAQTIQTINKTLIVGYILVFIIGVWTIYNQNRYGKLNRRKFKPSVSDEEIKEYFQLDDDTLNKMKSDKYIVLKDTII